MLFAESAQTRFSQRGVSLGVGSPALGSAQTAQGTLRAAGQTGNTRMQALGLAVAAGQAKPAVVLGKFVAGSAQSYEQIARSRGATYFEMGDWSKTSFIRKICGTSMELLSISRLLKERRFSLPSIQRKLQ